MKMCQAQISAQTLYSEAAQLERHYSTVRSAVSTFLVGFAGGITAFGIEKTVITQPFAVSLGAIVFLFAVIFNFNFQRLTYFAKKYQETLEELSAEGRIDNNCQLKFRKISDELHKNHTFYYPDAPAIILIGFIFIFYMIFEYQFPIESIDISSLFPELSLFVIVLVGGACLGMRVCAERRAAGFKNAFCNLNLCKTPKAEKAGTVSVGGS